MQTFRKRIATQIFNGLNQELLPAKVPKGPPLELIPLISFLQNTNRTATEAEIENALSEEQVVLFSKIRGLASKIAIYQKTKTAA